MDDDPLVVRALEKVLRRDHVVMPVTTGIEALEQLTSATPPFDLILCDLMMLPMSGMDLFARANALDAGLGQRFVFVTGGAVTQAAAAFLRCTPNERLEKPFDADELRAFVRRRVAVIDDADRPAAIGRSEAS